MQIFRLSRALRSRRLVLVGLLAITTLVGSATAAVAASSSSRPVVTPKSDWGPTPPGGYITNFVKYVHGTSKDVVTGKANPKLSPVVIGYSSNDAGGSIVPLGAEATGGVEAAVKWINTYAGGINGHPLELKECEILNSEEEGTACGEEFLDDSQVKLITYGALAEGADDIDNVVKGKKVTIVGFSAEAGNATAKNLFSLFTAGVFAQLPIGNFAKTHLHAKACAVSTPNAPGSNLDNAGMTIGCKALGLPTKSVAYDPDSGNLESALAATGSGQSGTATLAWPTTPAQCLATARALTALNVKPDTVVWSPSCINPAIEKEYPGGHYPNYYVANAQSGDTSIDSPTGLALYKAESQVGEAKWYHDPWWSGMWGQMLTIGQFLNEIGWNKITNATLLSKLKAWHGPEVLGAYTVDCGEYKFYPGACSDGNWYFEPIGNGLYKRISGFVQPSTTLVKALKALPKGAAQPTSWPFK